MRTTFKKAVLTVGLLGVVGTAEAQQQAASQQTQGAAQTASQQTQGALPRAGARTTGSLNQSFEFQDNANLSGSGSTFRSLTGFDFALTSVTRNATVSASTGISLQFDDSSNFSLARPKLNLGFETGSKRTRYSGNLSYATAPISVDAEQTDLSVLRVDADRTAIAGSFGVSHKLNATTDLSFGLRGSSVDFSVTSTAVAPTTDYGISSGIRYRLNQRTSMGLDGSLGFFSADNATNTESLSASLSGRLSHQLDTVSSFDGNLGLAFIDTTDTAGTATTSAFSVSLLFGAGLTQTLPDGSMGLTLSQTVNPSASGSLALGTQLGGSLTKNVNANESYTLDASLGRQEDVGGGTVTTFINVSPSYSRQLTRDVSATARYYFQRDDAGSTAQGVTLSFSRPFDFAVR